MIFSGCTQTAGLPEGFPQAFQDDRLAVSVLLATDRFKCKFACSKPITKLASIRIEFSQHRMHSPSDPIKSDPRRGTHSIHDVPAFDFTPVERIIMAIEAQRLNVITRLLK